MAKKPTFRQAMQEFVESETGNKFSSLSDASKSHWMTRFYLRNVVRQLEPSLVPEDDEDLETSLVDGSGDGGIDYISRENGQVVIVQAKHRGSGRDEEDAEVSKFMRVLNRLHPSRIGEYKLRQEVVDAARDIDWSNDTFDLRFITTGQRTEAIEVDVRNFTVSIPDLHELAERVELSFLDETGLNEEYREALSLDQSPAAPVELTFVRDPGSPPWLVYDDGDHRCYIGRVRGNHLASRYDHPKQRLFAFNIRNYQGDTAINKGIRSTATDDPRHFFFFNTGVSAVATSIDPDEERGTLRCERLSIINGAQTVRALNKAHQSHPNSTKDVEVLLRVTTVSLRQKPEHISFLENVTRFNNTQNAIRISDFRSNDLVQVSLSKFFDGVYRAGKSHWYKHKRTGDRDPKRVPIGMEQFTKTVFSFRQGPPDYFGGTAHLFDTGPSGGYSVVFPELTSTLEPSECEQLAGTWFLCEAVKEELPRIKEERIASLTETDPNARAEAEAEIRNALERRWLLFYAVGEALRQLYASRKIDLDRDLRSLAKPDWLDDDGKTMAQVRRLAKVAATALIRVYRNASQMAEFSHRNYFRSTGTLEAIRRETTDLLSVSELPDLRGQA